MPRKKAEKASPAPLEHARLSASSSHRWLLCPPSVRLSEGIEDTGSDYAAEGTDCHTLCAYLVEKALGKDVRDPTKDLKYYTSEMQTCAEEYCSFVMEQLEEAKKHCTDPAVFVEQHVDFSKWVKDGFGTADCLIVADELLQVVDMKYGLGVLVSAEDPVHRGNPQLMLYALGALEALDGIYDISDVKLTIFQPRRGNISSYSISKADLLNWAENILMPKAQLAYEGGGEFLAGSHCLFCKAKAICRKRAEHNLELAKYDFAKPDTLDDIEISAILSRIDQLISWGSDVKEYALQEAKKGKHYLGFKLVEGRSNRKYTDEIQVAHKVTAAGYDPYEKSVLSVTAMTKLLGKKQFDELLGDLVYKPTGKPTLVPETDKRPELNTAANDFNEK